MNTLLTVALIASGLATAGLVWTINLQIQRYARLARWGSVLGVLSQLAIFVYSIDFVKGADYSPFLIFAIAFGMTVVWLLACGFAVGVFIILAVGLYWLITTYKQTDFHEFWGRVKNDFQNQINRVKSWIDDEE